MKITIYGWSTKLPGARDTAAASPLVSPLKSPAQRMTTTFALYSRPESSEDTNAPRGATCPTGRPATGDAEAFGGTESGLFSVSNLSAHLPRGAMRSRTSPRPVSADELGQCGAEHGAGERCVAAALASRQAPFCSSPWPHPFPRRAQRPYEQPSSSAPMDGTRTEETRHPSATARTI